MTDRTEAPQNFDLLSYLPPLASSTIKRAYSLGMSDNNLLDEQQAADLLRVSVKTLQGWRQRNIGPRYFKLSNRVRYSPDDLRLYLAQCAVEPARPQRHDEPRLKAARAGAATPVPAPCSHEPRH